MGSSRTNRTTPRAPVPARDPEVPSRCRPGGSFAVFSLILIMSVFPAFGPVLLASNAAGRDASATECHRIYGLDHFLDRLLGAWEREKGRKETCLEACSISSFLRIHRAPLIPIAGGDEEGENYPLYRDLGEEFSVSAHSRFLDRGYRNPWMAGLASLVIPGAGQFYNSAAPYTFTLRGFALWMYIQGGAHVGTIALFLLNQFTGMQVELAGGAGKVEITERSAQAWRVVHVVNAVVASVTAFIEARIINRAGRRYVIRTRMRAYYDPYEGAACLEVALTF